MDSVNIVTVSVNDLKNIVYDFTRMALSDHENEKCKNVELKSSFLPDRITNLSEVEAITNLKKSSIYKLSANGGIPCAKFGNKKLIFSRSELLAWVENKTVKPVNHELVMAGQLAKSVNKNQRK